MVIRPVRLVGIDCASRAHSVGLAVGTFDRGQVAVDSLAVGRGDGSMREAFARTVRLLVDEVPLAIVALDAPLGWPAPLARALEQHRAGDRVGDLGEADHYVSRNTDAIVHQHVGTWPLDVGADLIARTAFAALELIAALREGGHELPLLWTPGAPEKTGAIEVYPKATLLTRRVSVKGYKSAKKSESEPARRALVEALGAELAIPAEQRGLMVETDHALDAVACLLAAKDFLDGVVIEPTEAERGLAEREGWIWFRRPRM
jgi:hypothetical protein